MNFATLVRALLIGTLAATTALRAQDPDPVISPTRGFHPAHSYSISDVESIDTATGALSLHIPLAQLPPGPAGFSAGLSLVYSSKYWEAYPVPVNEIGTFYYLVPSASGGWQFSLAPKLDFFWFEDTSGCQVSGTYFQLRLVDPDGSSHVLLRQGPGSWQGRYCLDDFQTVTTPTIWHSIDGSFLQLTLAAPNPNEDWLPDTLSWSLSRNDGSTVEYDIAEGRTYLRDRNDNTITIEPGMIESGHSYREMHDELGRTIRMDHYLGGNDEITQTGHDGDTENPLKWTIQYTSPPPFTPPTDDYWCIEDLLHTQWTNVCDFPGIPALVSSIELPNGLSYDFTYGSPVRYGELKQMTLPSGATVDYSYRLDSNTNKAIYFELLYNWVKTKTVGHDGASESWEYDHNAYGYFGSLSSTASVTSPDDGVTQYEFHELSYYHSRPLGGILQKITQPDGSTLERDWDFNFPVGLSSGWPNPWVKTETRTQADASGSPVTEYRQVFTTDKNGNITSRKEHDATTLLRKTVMTETDPNGNETSYSYDAIPGCPDTQADSSDLYQTGMERGGGSSVLLEWAYEYNCVSGLREAATDPNGLSVTTEYDRYGRPTLRDEDGLRATHVTYDDEDRWIVTQEDVESSDDKRNVRVARFDQLGRLRLTQQLEQIATPSAAGANESLGIRVETKYKFTPGINAVLVSNPYRTSDPAAPTRGWTATRQDTSGRECAVETFAGATEPALAQNCVPSSGAAAITSYDYDADSAFTEQTITDPAGAVRVLRSDVLGHLLAVIEDPSDENLTTTYTHDLKDNLTGVAQGATSRSFAYSSLSRLLSAANPESGTTTYSYDNAGNLLTRANGGVTRTSAYDDQNRVLTYSYNDGTPGVTFTYDSAQTGNRPASCSGDGGPKGRLAKVSSATFTSYYFHSLLGHTACTRQTVQTYDPFDFLYTLTPQGEWAEVVYPSGRTLATALDDAGRPISVAGASAYASGLQYAAHGAVGRMTLGNGTVETAEYNAFLQLTSLKLGATPGASDRWRLQNGFPSAGNNGNVLSQTVTVLNGTPMGTQYGYDGLNRLKMANEEPTSTSNPVCPDAGSNWCQGYGYDARGNRSVEAESNLGLPLGRPNTFGTNNRIADAGYGYDSRGNLNLLPTGERYLYDGEGRQVVYCAGFVSAGDCSNPAKTLGKMVYYYDGEGRRVGKVGGGVTQVFVYDARGQLAAEYGGAGEVSGTHYVTTDHLGTTRVVTDASKAVLQCRDYLPFGDELLATSQNGRSGIACYSGETGLRQKFTGKERDSESRLDYFGARYYSWAAGRFTSPDPKMFPSRVDDPQSWNHFAYSRNNPLRYVDPNGEDWEDVLNGTQNAVISNNFAGLGRLDSGNSDFRLGQAIGDALSTVQGTVEVLVGGGTAGGGFALSTTGVGAVAGVPASAAGTALVGHGSTVAASGFVHLAKSVPNPFGTKGAPDHQQTVAEEAAKIKGDTEVTVKTPGGEKGSRRIDAARVEKGRVTEAVQIFRPNKSGNPPAREQRAARDIENATGAKPRMVPVRRPKEELD